jgi:hypothetical protein
MNQKPRKPFDYQAVSEEQIQEGYSSGQFENLPGYGEPIANIDEPQDDDWWIKEKLKREKISFLPPSLEILRDVEKTLAHAMSLKREDAVRQEIEQLNLRIRDANLHSVWGPPSTQMPVDVEHIVRQWREGRATR